MGSGEHHPEYSRAQPRNLGGKVHHTLDLGPVCKIITMLLGVAGSWGGSVAMGNSAAAACLPTVRGGRSIPSSNTDTSIYLA